MRILSDFKDRSKLEISLFLCLSLFVFFTLISISFSQIFLFLALIFWLILTIKNKEKIRFPSFFWALIFYSLFTLLSAAFSIRKELSFKDSREIFLFLIVVILYMGFKSISEIKNTNSFLLVSAWIASGYSIIYYIFKAQPGERITGLMGHYMTQAGLMLLVICFALSFTLFAPKKFKIPWGITLFLAFIALLLTLTRSAWVGLIFAGGFILYLYKPKALIVIPVIIIIFLIFAPHSMKQRAISIFSLQDESNLDRIYMLQSGLRIIRDHPLTGTGPATIPIVYEKYKLPQVEREGIHLHNNLIQIAAERGIPALLLWFWFIIAAFLSLFKLAKDKNEPYLRAISIGALGTIIGLFIAGLFEYNFGDSEIKMLFLYIITIPFSFQKILQRNN
ncbi:MAG: O-antigen ligase family protein [Candidatus Aminicenantia bacterium]